MQLRRAPSSPAPVEAEAETAPDVADFGSNADFAAGLDSAEDTEEWFAGDGEDELPSVDGADEAGLWGDGDEGDAAAAVDAAGAPATANATGLDLVRDVLRGPPTTVSVNGVDPDDLVAMGFVEVPGPPGSRWFQHPKGHVVQLVGGGRRGTEGGGGDSRDWIRPEPFLEIEARKAQIRVLANEAEAAESAWRAKQGSPPDEAGTEAARAAITARFTLRDTLKTAIGLEATWEGEIEELRQHGEAVDEEALPNAMRWFGEERDDNDEKTTNLVADVGLWQSIEAVTSPGDGGDEVPGLELPDVPGLELPDVPGLELPDVPGVELPDFGAPDGGIPDFGVPDLGGTELPLPEIPDLGVDGEDP